MLIVQKNKRDLCHIGKRDLVQWMELCFEHVLLLFLFIYGAVEERRPLLLQTFCDLLYQPLMMDCDGCGAINGMTEWQGNLKYSEETCPSAALSTTESTCLGPGWNPNCRNGKPAINRLSYGTAEVVMLAHRILVYGPPSDPLSRIAVPHVP
jgi:hypothetical protein